MVYLLSTNQAAAFQRCRPTNFDNAESRPTKFGRCRPIFLVRVTSALVISIAYSRVYYTVVYRVRQKYSSTHTIFVGSFLSTRLEFQSEILPTYLVMISQVDGRPPVLTATSQSNGNGQTLTTHRIQTP